VALINKTSARSGPRETGSSQGLEGAQKEWTETFIILETRFPLTCQTYGSWILRSITTAGSHLCCRARKLRHALVEAETRRKYEVRKPWGSTADIGTQIRLHRLRDELSNFPWYSCLLLGNSLHYRGTTCQTPPQKKRRHPRLVSLAGQHLFIKGRMYSVLI
jgi:hypothetical protein